MFWSGAKNEMEEAIYLHIDGMMAPSFLLDTRKEKECCRKSEKLAVSQFDYVYNASKHEMDPGRHTMIDKICDKRVFSLQHVIVGQ